MGRRAERVYTDPAIIEHIDALTTDLPTGARVAVVCTDGSRHTGVVAERPIVQLFYDDEGREGFNAVLRLEGDGTPMDARYVWLDRVRELRKLETDGDLRA